VSSSVLRKTMIVLTAVGLCLAAYLTYVHYSGVTPPCSIKGNPCSEVQKSQYSLLVGVPVALIGLLGYIAILGSLLLARDGERARFVTMALILGGFGFSLYLTYRELFTLHKICEWCVSSAVIMTVLACLSVWRFLRGDDLLLVDTIPNDATQISDEAPEPAAPLGAAHS
jgi:uncharacterized membrane protein